MNLSGRRLALAAALTAVSLVVVAVSVTRRGGEGELAVHQPDSKNTAAESVVEADAEYVIIGGVRRKATDLKPLHRVRPQEKIDRSVFDPGTTEPVALDANPQVASVVEAIRENKHPERLTPIIMPAAFDRAKFLADPQAYMNIVEPGRVFQTAQPGPGIRALRPASSRFHRINQGESTTLRVRSVPKAPVTFTSFDLGRFQNDLTSITVQADAEGFAEAEFIGARGTFNDVSILAGSPLTTGRIKFVVEVVLPGDGQANAAGG